MQEKIEDTIVHYFVGLKHPKKGGPFNWEDACHGAASLAAAEIAKFHKEQANERLATILRLKLRHKKIAAVLRQYIRGFLVTVRQLGTADDNMIDLWAEIEEKNELLAAKDARLAVMREALEYLRDAFKAHLFDSGLLVGEDGHPEGWHWDSIRAANAALSTAPKEEGET